MTGNSGWVLLKSLDFAVICFSFLFADSVATFCGGILGTSTVTTMAESATGVNAGARTGLAAVTGAMLFLISLLYICKYIYL